MTRITEHSIEELAIELLGKFGYEYVYAPHTVPDGETPERKTYEQVLLLDRFRNAIKRINKSIPSDAQTEVIKEIQRIASPELLVHNESFQVKYT